MSKPSYQMVQMRVGKAFAERITQAAFEAGVSRNAWVLEAVAKRLRSPSLMRRFTTARELMAHRVALTVRVPPKLLTKVDTAAKAEGVLRTVWVLDACLSAFSPARQKAA